MLKPRGEGQLGVIFSKIVLRKITPNKKNENHGNIGVAERRINK